MGCLLPGLLFMMIAIPGLTLGLLAHPLFFFILLLLLVLVPRIIIGSGRS